MTYCTRERVYDQVVRLSGAHLELASLIDELGQVITRAIPHAGACWHTMDPATLIETSFRTVDLPPHGTDVAANEYLHDDYNTFVELARSSRHSGVLSEATAGELERSRRYREFLEPAGMVGELRTSLVVKGACWGSFALFRPAPADFSAEERDFAHTLAAPLGRGFRAATVGGRMIEATTSAEPGLILLDGRRRVESITATARRWLLELGFTGDPAHDRLPHVLLAVAARAHAAGADATARTMGTDGRWILLHASAASGGRSGRVAIIVQGATPASIAPLIAAAYGLSRRERQLTDLVLQGHLTRDIATQLLISPHTVQEHLKSIFIKTGVRSRRELVGQVFMRHYQPRIQPIGETSAS